MGKRFTTREAAMTRSQEPRHFEEVADDGGDIWLVREMSLAERDKFEDQCINRHPKTGKTKSDQFRGTLLSLCLADDKGKALFTEVDVGWLGDLCSMEKVVDACLRINRLRPGDAEELEKNSVPTPPSDSASTCATNGAAPQPSLASA